MKNTLLRDLFDRWQKPAAVAPSFSTGTLHMVDIGPKGEFVRVQTCRYTATPAGDGLYKMEVHTSVCMRGVNKAHTEDCHDHPVTRHEMQRALLAVEEAFAHLREIQPGRCDVIGNTRRLPVFGDTTTARFTV